VPFSRDFGDNRPALPKPETTTPDPQGPTVGAERTIFAIGELVSGVYEVMGLLGEGGMGQVFEAVDHVLNRRVALKASFAEPHIPPIVKEARALAAFRHPSLVTVHTLGEHRGLDYIVMERVYGTSLADHLERRAATGRPIEVREGLELLVAVTEGLSVVHRAGLAHRDVKPDNIMLTADQRVVLMDFGLVLADFEIAAQTTIAGSPPYMAPEALSNTVEAGSGHLVDLYALGVTAFELFAGRRPVECESLAELWRRHATEAVPRLDAVRDGLPPRLVQLVAELMAKDPGERPQSAEAVAWQLRAIRDHAHAAPAESEASDRLEILIVEDDPQVARILEFYAKKTLDDVAVRVARDGLEALAALRAKAPDIMLLDLHMPKMNGVEVCMHLRGEGLADGTAIIAVSAGAQPDDIQLLHQLGIHHFVQKGSRVAERLGASLLEVCGRPSVRPPSPTSGGAAAKMGRP
jgi:serine/threonine-protein kinase